MFIVSNLKYDIYAVHGGRIPFGVRTDSGAVFVKEPLDYEEVILEHRNILGKISDLARGSFKRLSI